VVAAGREDDVRVGGHVEGLLLGYWLCQTETGGAVWRTTLDMALVLILVLVLAAGFVVFCEVDLARAEEVRYLPKWVWAILCLGIGLTIPFGGIAYLVFGKVRRPRPANDQGSLRPG
jgi:hypothetical protein